MEKQLLECFKNEDGRWQLTVRVAPAEFTQTLEVVYQLCKDQVEIEGVEKGKATREQAEAALGKDFFYPQAAQQCCAQALNEILAEEKLPVVGYPDVEKCSTDEEGLIFTALYDEYPAAKLGDYKKIRVHLPEPTVEEGEITALLEQYARRAAKHIELDRPAQEGDTLHIDLEGTMESGSPVPGGKAEDYAIKVGSHTLLPQLEEGMLGMKAGEKKEITLTFPKEYAEELAGKKATFTVTVNAVCEVEVPVVDEDFAKTFFEVDMATLRAEVKASVMQDKMAEHRAKVAEAALSQASGQMDCLLPESMILKEVDTKLILVEIHAEATSEKLAMGHMLDGRVSAVWGTHTHVPTADMQILPKGTGYVTDLGMTGPKHSVLGIRPELSIQKFRGDLTSRYQWANGPTKMEAVLFTVDTDTGLCKSTERWDLSDENPAQR